MSGWEDEVFRAMGQFWRLFKPLAKIGGKYAYGYAQKKKFEDNFKKATQDDDANAQYEVARAIIGEMNRTLDYDQETADFAQDMLTKSAEQGNQKALDFLESMQG